MHKCTSVRHPVKAESIGCDAVSFECGGHPLRNTERVLKSAAADRLQEGQMRAGVWSCGMVAGLIHDVPTVRELVDRIMVEADAIIRQRLMGALAV